jgi:uncharacterized membrane protein (UPF0127 family)
MRASRALLALALALSACSGGSDGVPATSTVRVESGSNAWEITVEIAATPEARARGLMGRAFLPPDRGMLFLYPESAPQSFWMKECLVAIDAAYVGKDGRIVNIAEMKPEPGVEYPRSYPSDGPVRLVLEMAGGWFREHGVEPGDRVVVPDEILRLELSR